jgi:YggT family protein
MLSLLKLISLLIDIYSAVIIAYVILGLLIAFGIVNVYNRVVNLLYEFLTRATEPVLRPIRKLLPNFGPVDLSPLVVLIGLWFAQSLLWEYGPQLFTPTEPT